MFDNSVSALAKSANKTNTMAGVKFSLLVGTILTTSTLAFANEPTQSEILSFKAETTGNVVENIITVRSSVGERWDTVSDGEYSIEISGETDSERVGKVSGVNLYSGNCITNQCSTHPSMWSATPNQEIAGFKLEVDFTSDDLLTWKNSENMSPASWLGEQLIAECNSRMGEDGPTIDHTIPVNLPFSIVMNTENSGDVRRTDSADFLLNCMAFDGNLASLDTDEEVAVASTGDVWTGGSSTGDEGDFGDGAMDGEGPGFDPEDEGEGPGELDLGGLFPIPLPPEDPVIPEVPEEPVDPVVNPGLGEMPDDFATPDGGVGPDPVPDPGPIIVWVPPVEPVDPGDPVVNPGLGDMPGDLTGGTNPTHSGNKDKAEKKAIRDALKKKRKAKLKKKAKQKQALLDAQRKKQEAKKKRKAEKKAIRDALNKKKAKKKKVAKRVNPKPAKKVIVKKANGKKVKVKTAIIAKPKKMKPKRAKIVKVKKTKIKVAPVPLKKRALKLKKRLKKKQAN